MNPVGEYTKFWRVPQIADLELLHATYITQNFSRHMHDCYAFGVVERGVQAYYYRGAQHTAPPGYVVNCLPGEVHTGHAATSEGWTYRMFYPGTALLQQVASEMADRSRDLPFFSQTVINDSGLALRLHRLHQMLEDPSSSLLENQSRLLMALAHLIARYADDPPLLIKAGAEDDPIRRVRDFIDTHSTSNISLDELVAVAHLSAFYLVRVFTREVGLPPHAYLTQKRVMAACRLLRMGVSLSQTAVEVGFADQSHLHRHFKRIMGMTPGEYQSA